MPKKPRLNSELAHRLQDEPFLKPALLLFSVEERGELRKFFQSQAWRKAIFNARLSKPNEFHRKSENPALNIQNGNDLLHLLQGWRLCEMAIATQVDVPKEPAKQPKDDYRLGLDSAMPGAPKA